MNENHEQRIRTLEQQLLLAESLIDTLRLTLVPYVADLKGIKRETFCSKFDETLAKIYEENYLRQTDKQPELSQWLDARPLLPVAVRQKWDAATDNSM